MRKLPIFHSGKNRCDFDEDWNNLSSLSFCTICVSVQMVYKVKCGRMFLSFGEGGHVFSIRWRFGNCRIFLAEAALNIGVERNSSAMDVAGGGVCGKPGGETTA
jgi:hypothetical protein